MLFLNGYFDFGPKFNLWNCSFNIKHLSYEFQEAAFDADKIFLASIDKFDAMMSKSNVYAPDGMITCLLFILMIITHVLMIMDIRRQITISNIWRDNGLKGVLTTKAINQPTTPNFPQKKRKILQKLPRLYPSSKEARAEENPSLFNLQKLSITYLYLPDKEYSTFPLFLSDHLEQAISPS